METLLLLRRILANQQLSVGDPDFERLAHQAIIALAELDQAIDGLSQQATPVSVAS